jgi:hypothetical protein
MLDRSSIASWPWAMTDGTTQVAPAASEGRSDHHAEGRTRSAVTVHGLTVRDAGTTS